MSTENKTVYIVMRPLGNPRVNDGLKKLKNTPLIGDVATLSAILVLQHWGICIGDPEDDEPEYYHLKKLEDSSFALDITPFDPAAITLKVPIWEVDFPKSERLELGKIPSWSFLTSLLMNSAASIIAVMRGPRAKGATPIYSRGTLLWSETNATCTRYRPLIARLTTPQTLLNNGKYGLADFCWHFVVRYWCQVASPHASPLGWAKTAMRTAKKSRLDLSKAVLFYKSVRCLLAYLLVFELTSGGT
jgi:hypothetical protein